MIRSEILQQFLLDFGLVIADHGRGRPTTFGQLRAALHEKHGQCEMDELLDALFMLQPYAELKKFVKVGEGYQSVSFERVRNTPQWADFFMNGTFNIQVSSAGRVRCQELAERLERDVTSNKKAAANDATDILVLISHSSRDKDLAEALIELLRLALGLRANQIRCTSVDGYRLPAGVNTDEQLRAEIKNVRVFIGLLTPNSVASTYVLFELGARWGAELSMIPLLAGIGPDKMPGPQRVLNALSCETEAQLLQLLDDVGRQLNLDLQSPAAYLKHIKTVKELSESVQIPEDESEQQSELEAENLRLKSQLAAKEEMEPSGPYNYFWRNDGTVGPYCPKCWQKDGKKVLLPAVTGYVAGKGRLCTVCNEFYVEEPRTTPLTIAPRGYR